MSLGNMNKGKFFKSFDNTKIWYKYIKGKKTCLVFLHGLTGSSSAWRPFYPDLQKKGHAILLIDIRGHGLSDKPSGNEKYTLENASKDLYYLLSVLKIKKIILIGHCYGGMISQLFYEKNPDYVKKIILINTHYNFSSNIFRYVSSWLVYFIYYFMSFLLYPLHFEKNHVHLNYTKFRISHDLSLKRLYEDIRATSFRTFLPFTKNTLHVNFTSILKKIKVPVLILHGKKDLIIPVRVAHEMKNLIKTSTLKILDTNHVSVINVPEEILSEITNFL